MVTANAPNRVCQLVEENLGIARAVSFRLKARYAWVTAEDAYSYSLWGLMLAAQAYCPDKSASFPIFASQKAMFLAIDQMRKEKLLRHRPAATMASLACRPPVRQCPLLADIPDGRSSASLDALEARDAVRVAMRRLPAEGRQFLLMHYADGMTFREIACVLHLSESAVCLRHKALIARLRHAAGATQGILDTKRGVA